MKAKFTSICFFLFLIGVLNGQSNLYDLIKASPNHIILGLLVDATGYSEDLKTTDSLTIFAPTDAAFSKLGTAQLISILSNPNEAIDDLLLRHAVEGLYPSSSLTNGQMLTSVSEDKLTIALVEGLYKVNGVIVTSADIPATNGLMNIIGDIIPKPLTGTTVADIILNSPDHTTLALALTLSGAEAQFRQEGPYTVFAPTDAAFQGLDSTLVQSLLADPNGKLANVLLYHATIGNFTSTSLTDGQEILMSNGQRVTISFDGDIIKVNNAKITVADIKADNGVVHVIDAVLIPNLEQTNTVFDIIAKSPNHKVLFNALALAGFDKTLRQEGPYTVFAPTDAAFQSLPQGIIEEILLNDGINDLLLNHVSEGKSLSPNLLNGNTIAGLAGAEHQIVVDGDVIHIDNAIITVKDIIADNGVVHIIDAVLAPSTGNTIYDVVLKSPNHRILQGLINLSGLKEELIDQSQEFTLFAPTDEAFGGVPDEIMQEILDTNGDLLYEILGRHAVAGINLSSSLTDGKILTTIDSQQVQVKLVGSDIMINNAKVIAADIAASNGIVHVIDAVILESEVLGVKVLGTSAGKIFPNPATNVLQYDFSSSLKGAVNIQLLDSKGSLMKQYKGDAAGSLDISGMQTGIYVMKIADEHNIASKIVMIK